LFTDSWRGFNNLFYQFAGNSEQEKIQNFLSENIPEDVAKDLIKNHRKEIAYLISQPINDMRGNGNDTSPSIIEFSNSDSNLGKLGAIFKMIYQVRCNLEHGQKSPNRDRDIELCASAWPLVADLVDRNI